MKNRISVLVTGCLVLLFAGVIYAWSVLKAPLATEFGWQKAELQLCFTITLCFFCLGGLASGLAAKKISLRVRLIAAAVLIFAGFGIASKASALWSIYISYGVLAGTGIGIVYNGVISAVNACFADKKGLSSGLMMMSFGFSALLLGKLANALFEPIGRFGTYFLLGSVTAAAVLISAFVLKAAPAPAKQQTGVQEGLSTAQMVKRPSFWLLFVFFTLLAAVGSTAIGFGKDFFTSIGLADGAAVTVAGLLSIFNGLGRLASGAIFDALGIKKTQLITSGVAILSPALALVACLTSQPILGIIGLCLCGFTYGFSPTVSAALVGDFYGMKHFSLNFPVLNLVLIPASFVSTLAASLVESSGGYVSTFIVLTAMSVVGLIINLTIKKA